MISSSPPTDLSPDGMSVHHHHQLVKRLGQLRRQLGRVLQRLLAAEVEDVLFGHVVVDHSHTIVVAHKGGHGGGRPVDGVGVMGLGPGLHQQRADLGLRGEAREVEASVIVFVISSVRVSTFKADKLESHVMLSQTDCTLFDQIFGNVLPPLPGGVH